MDERHLPRQPVARLLVDQLDAQRLQPRELSRDVVGVKADVVQRLAATFKEARDAGVVPRGLQQLDLVLAKRQQHAAHACSSMTRSTVTSSPMMSR